MKDFFSSIKEHILHRFGSPLFGAFAFAWLAINHQYLVILFSDGPVAIRLDLATQRAFPDFNAVLYQGFLFPLFIAFSVITVYPLLSRLAVGWTLEQDRITRDLEHEIMRKITLSLEEADILREKHQERIKSLREENDQLSRRLATLEARPGPDGGPGPITRAVRAAVNPTGPPPGTAESMDPEVIANRQKAKRIGVIDAYEVILTDRAVLDVLSHLISAGEKSREEAFLANRGKIPTERTAAKRLLASAEKLGLMGRDSALENPVIWLTDNGRQIAALFNLIS